MAATNWKKQSAAKGATPLKFTIKRGVPIPPRKRGRDSTAHQYPFAVMVAGEVAVFDLSDDADERRRQIARLNSAMTYAKKSGVRLVQRQMEPSRIGVWCIVGGAA